MSGLLILGFLPHADWLEVTRTANLPFLPIVQAHARGKPGGILPRPPAGLLRHYEHRLPARRLATVFDRLPGISTNAAAAVS